MSKNPKVKLWQSVVLGALIMFNIFAVATFFFVQVGSIFFIVPAAIIDVMYMLDHERVGPRRDSIQPSHQIMKLAFTIVLACLIIFTALFLLQIYKTN